ncbi:hypothetical protein C8K11_12717 [Novosphingobium sp. GV055]|nr:hypothetical protein C8K11_12717 [Novosphingobium sp. GV055]PUA94255.1 hypothetical protein C8K12_12717 [Novosphingobium sp. GV061]PUB12358.1 hypothetical protein C8K14_12717 [Novosphingobium sp. GV079]PUB37272.1 hypothetical protein C8K10_12717 [Novosphingobium sp. GV027]
MCAPALPIIAAGMAVAGTAVKTISAMQQATVQARVADANAAAERDAAQQDQQNAQQAALQRYREIARVKGQQAVAAAANGVSLDFGTAADVVSDTDMLGREDVANIYRQGSNTLRSHDINAANYGAQANAARASRTNALISGALDMGSTVLGTASQYGAFKGGAGFSASSIDYGSMAKQAKKAGATAYSLMGS